MMAITNVSASLRISTPGVSRDVACGGTGTYVRACDRIRRRTIPVHPRGFMRTTAVVAMAMTVLTACGSDPASPSVATVIITAPKQTIAVGEPVQLSTTARDANGGAIGTAKFTYAAVPNGVVSVSSGGRVIGVAQGSAAYVNFAVPM